MDLSREAIEKIEEMAAPAVIEVDGKQFSNQGLKAVFHDPRPNALKVGSLSGLVDCLKSGFDGKTKEDLIISVESHKRVSVMTKVYGPSNERDVYLTAELEGLNFQFDYFIESESFLIKMMTLFLKNKDRDYVLSVAGNMKDENVGTVQDDTVSQSVTVRVSVTKGGTELVKNPVILKPFRTFREVEQPESAFLFRLKHVDGKLPYCALFEADGGVWKIEAMKNIKDYLIKELGTGYTIIA